MKKAFRNFIHPVIFLLAFAFVLIPLPVAARTTTLKTSVPTEISLEVEIIGSGTVTVDGQKITKTRTVSIDRHSTVTVSIVPASGYQLKSVTLNGENVISQIKDGALIIEELSLDSVLSITFNRTTSGWSGSNPPTGDNHIEIAAIVAVISLTVLLMLIWPKRRHI